MNVDDEEVVEHGRPDEAAEGDHDTEISAYVEQVRHSIGNGDTELGRKALHGRG
jgi:hypothetical protein